MNSFTRKLVLNYTGVIFTCFLAVYFLFNALVRSYIREVAERELAGGMVEMVDFADMIFTTTHFVPDFTGIEMDGFTDVEIRTGSLQLYTHVNVAYVSPMPQIRMDNMGLVISGTPGTVELGEWGTFGASFRMRPLAQRASFIHTDVIIINHLGEVVTPLTASLPEAVQAEVNFLVHYYNTHTNRFEDNQMRRVRGTDATYYVSTSRLFSPEGTERDWSILMYTDISPAMVFTNRMNSILGALLVVSGLMSLGISLSLSARFKQAIVRLCNHAETIGHGQFQARARDFKDAEFTRLSKSMDNMSGMLQAYENNQKTFFQNASHELRTPLMSIQGYAEGILDGVFTKEEGAEIIKAEGHKMAALVDELLYISRMDSTVTVENHEPLDIQSFLNECCERVKNIASTAEKNLTFVPIADNATIFIHANPEKLERAVINLLTNAIRHAEKNITVQCQTQENNVTFTVQDDGAGINPPDIPHLFKRFYKGKNGNYGLGLAIGKDIIRNLKGQITAENLPLPQSGAVFTITLPLPPADNKN